MKTEPLTVKTNSGDRLVKRAYPLGKRLFVHRTLGTESLKRSYWTISNSRGWAVCRIKSPTKLKDVIGKAQMLLSIDWDIEHATTKRVLRSTKNCVISF